MFGSLPLYDYCSVGVSVCCLSVVPAVYSFSCLCLYVNVVAVVI